MWHLHTLQSFQNVSFIQQLHLELFPLSQVLFYALWIWQQGNGSCVLCPQKLWVQHMFSHSRAHILFSHRFCVMESIGITNLLSNRRQLGPSDVKWLVQVDPLTTWQKQHLLYKLDSWWSALYWPISITGKSCSYLKLFGLSFWLTSKQQII